MEHRHFYVALQQSCCNRYGFHDWGNTDMRGKQHAPNNLTRYHVKEMTGKGATQPIVSGYSISRINVSATIAATSLMAAPSTRTPPWLVTCSASLLEKDLAP